MMYLNGSVTWEGIGMVHRSKVLAVTLVLLLALTVVPSAFAQQQIFGSLSTHGGAGLGLEMPAGNNFSLVFALQQRGFLGGLRLRLPSPDVYAGFYLDSVGKGSAAAALGLRMTEGSGFLLSLEGGVRSRGDLFIMGTIGHRF